MENDTQNVLQNVIFKHLQIKIFIYKKFEFWYYYMAVRKVYDEFLMSNSWILLKNQNNCTHIKPFPYYYRNYMAGGEITSPMHQLNPKCLKNILLSLFWLEHDFW